MDREFVIHAFGTRGSRPVSGKSYEEFGGATTCYIIKWKDKALIIDCGTGLYHAKEVLKDCTEIYILLTHIHYDHVLGLLGWGIFPPGVKLQILANYEELGCSDIIEDLFARPHWPYSPSANQYEYIQVTDKLQLTDDIIVETHPTGHCPGAIMCIVYLGVHKVAFLFDFEFSPVFEKENLRDCEILFFDGMFAEFEYNQYIGWGHSYWERGCNLALDKNIKHLMITHHKPECTDAELRGRETLAKGQFPNTIFMRDMDLISLASNGFRYIKNGSLGTSKDIYYKMVMDRLIHKDAIDHSGITLLDSIEAVLQIVVESVHGEAGTFWFYNESGDGLIYPKTYLGKSDLSDITLELGQGIAGQVIQSGEGILVHDCSTDTRWEPHVDSTTGFHTESMICVPLQVKKSTFGCMQIINKTDGTFYLEDDMEFASGLLHKTMEMFIDNGLFLRDKNFCEQYKIGGEHDEK